MNICELNPLLISFVKSSIQILKLEMEFNVNLCM